jgi:IS5 family transposase
MRPKKHERTEEEDLFRARLDQIIDMKHELVQLAGRLDWDWLDGEIAPLYSDKGRPGIETPLRHWAAVAQAHLRPIRRGGV